MFRRDAPAISGPDPGLTIQVTPAKSAWYPGETFRARITFSNPAKTTAGQARGMTHRSERRSVDVLRAPTALGSPVVANDPKANTKPKGPRKRRERLHLIGLDNEEEDSHCDREQIRGTSSGKANDPEWRKQHPRSRSRSLDGVEESAKAGDEVDPSSKSKLEGRAPRNLPPSIPTSHSHSRKISLAQSNADENHSSITSPTTSIIGSPPPSISNLGSVTSPSRPDVINRNSGNLVSISEDGTDDPITSGAGLSQAVNQPARNEVDSASPDSYDGYSPGTNHRRTRPGHTRMPSYMNGYGSAPSTAARMSFDIDSRETTMPAAPGSHPRSGGHAPGQSTQDSTPSTTIIWAHARLRGRFTPSTTYIPPDPLLPLRTTLLHQPLGSGGFSTTSQVPPSSSGWITFGSGTIGNEQTPSLTGSLVGLAKGLVNTGIGVGPQPGGGTLEEERKRIWNSKDLPVLETMRTLVDVNEVLREGETASYNYEIPLPERIPPTFRGRALRFSYEVCISVNIGLDASGKRQRSEDFIVPVKIMAMESEGSPYDILAPIISKSDTGVANKVKDADLSQRAISHQQSEPDGSYSSEERVDSLDMLKAWAKALLATTDESSLISCNGVTTAKSIESYGSDSARADSTLQGIISPVMDPINNVVCATETRASSKTFFEIYRQGQQFAIVRLAKPAVVAGEAVSVVVQLNRANWLLHVCKFSATLMTDERIPYHLLPPSASSTEPVHPILRKIVAEHHSSLVIDTVELAFDLNVDANGVPGFHVAASSADDNHHPDHGRVAREKAMSTKVAQSSDVRNLGGLRWLIQFRFGVLPARDKPSLVPSDLGGGDRDNMYQAAPVSLVAREADQGYGSAYADLGEAVLDVVKCEVPVTILPSKLRGVGSMSSFAI